MPEYEQSSLHLPREAQQTLVISGIAPDSEEAQDCGELQLSEGIEIFTKEHEIGDEAGLITLTCDPAGDADEFQIIYDGTIMVSSGDISGETPVELEWYYFASRSGPTTVTVKVIGTGDYDWGYTLSCPDPEADPPINGDRPCLEATDNLAVTAVEDGFEVSFDYVEGATGYVIEYSIDGGDTYERAFLFRTDDIADPLEPVVTLNMEEGSICIRVSPIRFCENSISKCFNTAPIITEGAYMQITGGDAPPEATLIGMHIFVEEEPEV